MLLKSTISLLVLPAKIHVQIKEYQMNVTTVFSSIRFLALNRLQEISSCLVNLQSLATTFEMTKENFFASLDLANQHLNRSALHVQNINNKNQRAEHMLNSMREDHSKENLSCRDKLKHFGQVLIPDREIFNIAGTIYMI
jgi:hypothetical protein